VGKRQLSRKLWWKNAIAHIMWL